MAFNLLASKKFIEEFFKDPVKAMLLVCVAAIATLFTVFIKVQESRLSLIKENFIKCEVENRQRDAKISMLEDGKAKSDSILNRIIGKLEAIEELKQQKQNNENLSSSVRNNSVSVLQ